MPHLLLEYSSNIINHPKPCEVLHQLHILLTDSGLFRKSDIKSRVLVHQDYLVADGGADNAFIHLQVSILSGRAEEDRKKISAKMLECLKVLYFATISRLNCSVTVEIREMDKGCYSKEIFGKL